MRVTIQGTVFCVAGFFNGFQSRREIEDALREAGGDITAGVSNTTNVLVWDFGVTHRVQEAKTRGLPILNEAQLMQLLADGSIDVAFEAPSLEGRGASLDALLGEARGLLANPPSEDLWGALVELLGQCVPEHTEALVEYVDAHIRRWHERDQMLCVVPDDWIVSMIQGTDSPLYKLVRWLDLSAQRMSITHAKRLFGCARLTQVRRIDFPHEKKLSKAAFAAVAKNAAFESVRVLIFGKLFEGAAQGLGAGEALRHVHTVGSRVSWEYKGAELRAFKDILESEALSQVDRLSCVGPYSFMGQGDVLQVGDALGGIKHLVFDVLSHSQCHARYTCFECFTRMGSLKQSASFKRCLANLQTLTVLAPTGSSKPTTPWNLSSLKRLNTLRVYTSQECLDAPDALSRVGNVFHPHLMTFSPALERVVTNMPLEHPNLRKFAQVNSLIELVYEPYYPPFA